MEIWEPKPLGILWATSDLLRDTFAFLFGNYMDGSILSGSKKPHIMFISRVGLGPRD